MPVPAFDIDSAVLATLPPNKRKPKWLLFMRAMAYPYKRLQVLFRSYINGSVDQGYWNSATTYETGYRVRSLFGVYESLQGSNINHVVSDTNWWLKVADSFIGARERASYGSQKLLYEYALNRYFGTTYRNPTSINPGVGYLPLSDIYITTDVPVYTSLGIGSLPQVTGEIATIPMAWGLATVAIITNATTYKYTIHMPIAVFNALGADDAIRESIVRQFADLHKVLGLQYSITTY